MGKQTLREETTRDWFAYEVRISPALEADLRISMEGWRELDPAGLRATGIELVYQALKQIGFTPRNQWVNSEMVFLDGASVAYAVTWRGGIIYLTQQRRM